MRDFYELTGRGRVRRMRQLAAAALAHYSLRVERMRLLGDGWNYVFRLDTAGGEKFVLR